MSGVTAELVKKLRDMTGAGMMDCKAALADSKGNMDGAIEFLRKKGLKNLDKRAGKVAAEGVMGTYIHPGDQVVSVVELNSETDFVARSPEFKELAKGIAMHIAAMKPQYLSESEVPAEIIQKEKDIFMEQLSDSQRANAEKILPGKLQKFYEEVCLLNQPYVKDDSGKLTIQALIESLGVKVGEKLAIRRFHRFEVGEGIERAQTNFADEVASMVKN